MFNENQFYVHLPSDSSAEYFPSNTLSRYSTRLARRIVFKPEDKWMVGLSEISHPPGTVERIGQESLIEPIFVYTDIITPQYVGDTLVRAIRIVPFPSFTNREIFNPVYYVPVEKNSIESITISLESKIDSKIIFKPSYVPTIVTLHFVKVGS